MNRPEPPRAGVLHAFTALLLAVVPFAGCCALLFLRTWRVILVVFLIGAVWLVAENSAAYLLVRGGVAGSRSGICVGGLIGGVGLVLSGSTCYRRLLSPKYIFGGAVIGSMGALPLTFFLDRNGPPSLWVLGFAIWQAGIGTYLYAICTSANKQAGHGRSIGVNCD